MLGWRAPEDHTGGKKLVPFQLCLRREAQRWPGEAGCSKSNHICLISDPQSARDLLHAPGFALTLSEDTHSACFTGRILEAGMSLQARAGDSCSRMEFRPDGKGPQARGQATFGRKAATGGPGMWLSFPGGSFSICESEKGRQPWAEGPGTALP